MKIKGKTMDRLRVDFSPCRFIDYKKLTDDQLARIDIGPENDLDEIEKLSRKTHLLILRIKTSLRIPIEASTGPGWDLSNIDLAWIAADDPIKVEEVHFKSTGEVQGYIFVDPEKLCILDKLENSDSHDS